MNGSSKKSTLTYFFRLKLNPCVLRLRVRVKFYLSLRVRVEFYLSLRVRVKFYLSLRVRVRVRVNTKLVRISVAYT